MSDDSSKHWLQKFLPNHSSHSHGPKIWNPITTVFVTGLIFLLAQFFGAMLFGIGVAIVGDAPSVENWLHSNAGQFTFVVLFETLTLGFIWAFLKIKRVGWQWLGFGRSPNLRDIGYTLGAFAVYFGLLIVVSIVATQLLQIDIDQQQETGFSQAFGASQLWMIFVGLVILPPIVEEILFRGFLFTGLRTTLNFWWTTIITSVSFGALHLLTGVEGEGLLWIAGIDTFVLSLVLCYVREKTGALWACIGIHAIKNTLAFLYLFVIQ